MYGCVFFVADNH